MDLKIITEGINSAARLAGEFIRRERETFTASDIESKSRNNLVSYVDKTAEQMIVKELSSLLPEAGFITEENTISTKGERYNWIIDPLDGTTNFIHGVPCYSVSIALADGKRAIAGAIYEVNLDELFYGWENGGAYLNGNTIKVSETKDLGSSLLATGFPYHDYGMMDQYINLFRELMKTSRGLRRLGSAAVDMAYVACGRFDGFYEYGLNSWDIAAGAIIIEEAGGRVTDFSGKDDFLFGRELICSNTLVHQEFLEAFVKHFRS